MSQNSLISQLNQIVTATATAASRILYIIQLTYKLYDILLASNYFIFTLNYGLWCHVVQFLWWNRQKKRSHKRFSEFEMENWKWSVALPLPVSLLPHQLTVWCHLLYIRLASMYNVCTKCDFNLSINKNLNKNSRIK